MELSGEALEGERRRAQLIQATGRVTGSVRVERQRAEEVLSDGAIQALDLALEVRRVGRRRRDPDAQRRGDAGERFGGELQPMVWAQLHWDATKRSTLGLDDEAHA